MKILQCIQVAALVGALLVASASAQAGSCSCTKAAATTCTVLELNPSGNSCSEVTVPCEPCVCDPVGALTCRVESGMSYIPDPFGEAFGACTLQTTAYAVCP
eukprot:CAMPEP_0185844728 /NCGR_PEP_ID=MMETSP1354-20130828/844_1 /TAXON_ID=708628 /ORGANISM="Erythrolobus madagascarensis, Strain CCMP3276" /LENGTH=101 /DNA_ID=CAMNT_0028544491 /DNA_START=73 /DNA_END=375 /DNA_ORIENTATION=-